MVALNVILYRFLKKSFCNIWMHSKLKSSLLQNDFFKQQYITLNATVPGQDRIYLKTHLCRTFFAEYRSTLRQRVCRTCRHVDISINGFFVVVFCLFFSPKMYLTGQKLHLQELIPLRWTVSFRSPTNKCYLTRSNLKYLMISKKEDTRSDMRNLVLCPCEQHAPLFAS